MRDCWEKLRDLKIFDDLLEESEMMQWLSIEEDPNRGIEATLLEELADMAQKPQTTTNEGEPGEGDRPSVAQHHEEDQL